MKRLIETIHRLNEHAAHGYALIRIYLGVALFVRGFIMLANPTSITSIPGAQDYYMAYSYVIVGHLVGGLLLAIGLYGRMAALIQIPILFGAVFFIHLRQGLMVAGQSLELAALVLLLLAVFVVFGSGKLSVDLMIRMRGMKEAAARP